MPLASLKGESLDYWTFLRITMPKKSYERYPISKQFKIANAVGSDFGFPNKSLLTKEYKEVLEKHEKKFNVNNC
jgi:hypothetical protein